VSRARKWQVAACVGVMGLASLLYLWGVWAFPLSDPDAGLYADIASRMVRSGDWITPRFNGLRYLEKPPLLFWLIALTYRVAGASEWGAHLWPAVGGLGTVATTMLIGRTFFNPGIGLLSGLILATTTGCFVFARVVSTDLLFTCFIALGFFAFLHTYEGRGPRWNLLLYASLGLAVMTKGVIGLLLPGLVIVAFLLLSKELPVLKKLAAWWGVPLALGIALPWHAIVAARHEGFFSFYVVDNHILRFLGQRAFVEDDVPLSFPAFLLATGALFSPWSLFLPAALKESTGQLREPTRDGKYLLFLGLWGGLVVLFFALSPLKLEHYGLPAFPALALLVGRFWQGRWQQASAPSLWVLIPLATLCLAALLMATQVFSLAHLIELSFATDVYSRMVQVQGESFTTPLLNQLLPVFQASFVVLFVGSLVTFLLYLRQEPRKAFAGFALMTVLLLGLVGHTLTLVGTFRSVKPLVSLLRPHLSPEALVIHEGPLENSAGLAYYTGRQIYVVDGRRGDLDFGSRFPEAHGLFLDGEAVSQLWQSAQRIFLVTDRAPEHSVLRLTVPEARHLVGQEGRRWVYTNRAE
jgi:4-amino-4-deoxy-L-arabinose transferase-like glycosyltransferase